MKNARFRRQAEEEAIAEGADPEVVAGDEPADPTDAAAPATDDTAVPEDTAPTDAGPNTPDTATPTETEAGAPEGEAPTEEASEGETQPASESEPGQGGEDGLDVTTVIPEEEPLEDIDLDSVTTVSPTDDLDPSEIDTQSSDGGERTPTAESPEREPTKPSTTDAADEKITAPATSETVIDEIDASETTKTTDAKDTSSPDPTLPSSTVDDAGKITEEATKGVQNEDQKISPETSAVHTTATSPSSVVEKLKPKERKPIPRPYGYIPTEATLNRKMKIRPLLMPTVVNVDTTVTAGSSYIMLLLTTS